MKARICIVLVVWLLTWPILWAKLPFLPLWPSMVALLAVFLLGRAMTGLLVGASAGLILLSGGNPVSAFISGFQNHLIPSLQSSWNISVIIFTLLLGGFVALLEKGGGIGALIQKWLGKNQTAKKRVLWSTYGLGLVCFFDGLANSLLVGKSLTPIAKRLGISGVKMAYIVDSTSSAVACVAIISTWIAYQLSMIREGFLQVGASAEIQPFQTFLHSIPYNFYCWFTLFLLAVVILRNWNIGPMRRAETEISKTETLSPRESDTKQSTTSILPAILPLAILIVGLLIGLYVSGSKSSGIPSSFQEVSEAFGAADAALVLVCISALACIVAFAANTKGIQSKGEKPSQVFSDGVLKLFNPLLILVSAWLLSSTLKQLDAIGFLVQLLNGNLPPSLFPTLVFAVGACISFSTGTSWGTMGVLMPLALPVALHFSGGAETSLIYGTVAAVFSGAVFGDHCSPFSDTTIVSSISCDVSPIDHVKTQLPYALIAAGAAITLGFLPTAFGVSPFIGLATGLLLLFFLPSVTRIFTSSSG